jgi:hypothetical protein
MGEKQDSSLNPLSKVCKGESIPNYVRIYNLNCDALDCFFPNFNDTRRTFNLTNILVLKDRNSLSQGSVSDPP